MVTLLLLAICTYVYSVYFYSRTNLNDNPFIDSLQIVYGFIAVGILHMFYVCLPLAELHFLDKTIFVLSNGAGYVTYQQTWPTVISLNYIQVGLPEELAKFLALYIALYLDPPKNRAQSVYRGACVGLGFALLENYMYVTNLNASMSIRLLLPTLLHSSLGAIMGHFLYEGRRQFFLKGLAICAIIHGTYDIVWSLNFSRVDQFLIGGLIVGVALYFCENIYKRCIH